MDNYIENEENIAKFKEFFSEISNPSTPLELMKSRYFAFKTDNYKYLYDTHCEETRNFTLEDLENSNKKVEWVDLKILDYSEKEETVTFIAYYRENMYVYEHKEKSKFKKINDKWFYYGILDFPKQIKLKPNEPCSCRSGKKYKKCCGK